VAVLKTSTPRHLHLDHAAPDLAHLDVRLPEYYEEVTGSCILELVCHVQLGFMRARSTWSAPSFDNSLARASEAVSRSKPASTASRAAATGSGRDSVPNFGSITQGARLVDVIRSSRSRFWTPAVRRWSSTAWAKTVPPTSWRAEGEAIQPVPRRAGLLPTSLAPDPNDDEWRVPSAASTSSKAFRELRVHRLRSGGRTRPRTNHPKNEGSAPAVVGSDHPVRRQAPGRERPGDGRLLHAAHGTTGDRLPTALQILGRPRAEPTVLRIAAELQRAAGGAFPRPTLPA